jgi:hypothetical protein
MNYHTELRYGGNMDSKGVALCPEIYSIHAGHLFFYDQLQFTILDTRNYANNLFNTNGKES